MRAVPFSPAVFTPRAPSDDSFTWTSAASLQQASQVVDDADHVADTIARACEELFPRHAGYRVHEDRFRGNIRGRRYRICRGGFVGLVSVQLFASRGGYRHDDAPPLQLRVVGRRRFETPAPLRSFPTESLMLGTIIMAVALLMVVLGGRGWWAVTQHPSLSWFIDGVGFVGAAALVILAATTVVALAREGVALPWVDLWAHLRARLQARLRWLDDPAADGAGPRCSSGSAVGCPVPKQLNDRTRSLSFAK